MRLIYGSPLVDGSVKGKPVVDSFGAQIVPAMVLDGSDLIVLILDNVKGSYFIEKVIDRFRTDVLMSENFMKLSDEEYNAYASFFRIAGLLPGVE